MVHQSLGVPKGIADKILGAKSSLRSRPGQGDFNDGSLATVGRSHAPRPLHQHH